MSAVPARIGVTSARDRRGVVLVVGVGVDDHVGAELQARVESRLEPGGKALVVGQADDVVDAVVARDRDRPVGRAVVDDQPLDLIEPLDLAREVGQRQREGLLLVEARDLDDEFHCARTDPPGAEVVRPPGAGIGSYENERAVDSRGQYPRGCGFSPSQLAGTVPFRLGKRFAHPAVTGHLAHRCMATPACAAVAVDRARTADRGTHRRVLRIPDLPQLRQLLLAAVGARAAARHDAVVRCLPCGDGAPAGDRVRRRDVAPRARGRPRDGRVHAGVVRGPGDGRLPAGARHVHDLCRADRGGAVVHALRLPVPGRARLHRHPVPGDGHVGGSARVRAPAPRRCRGLAAAVPGAR